MTWINWWRAGISAVSFFLLLATAGCDLLDVSDPTAIEDDHLNNPRGGALLRGDALREFYASFGELAAWTGEASDEFTAFTTASASEFGSILDRRESPPLTLGSWGTVRRAATVAVSKLERFGPRAHAGEMLALRGQATLLLAANFCPGFPITELDGFTAKVGSPLTTAQAYERALEDFDAALLLAADSGRVLNFARVGRATALLGLGRFAEAASAVQEVPTSFAWGARYIAGVSRNPLVFNDDVNTWRFSRRLTIANREGGNGLDFISAGDPRVQVRGYSTAAPPIGPGVPVYNPAKYANDGASIVVTSGIQARLIEAEAALVGGNAAWLSILNSLRATQVSPSMPALADPGTPEARLHLLFRERAFWLFATGQRLADMLRLVRLYGRDPERVFPAGEYHQHGLVYGKTTSFPFVPAEQGNPASVTGCTGL